jgi:PAS domain S-box-containing protein
MLLTTDQLLYRSNQRLKATMKAVSGVHWTANSLGEMVEEQEAWASMTGQTFDEYEHFGWTKAVHEDDLQNTLDAWHNANANADAVPFTLEQRVRRHDGEWRLFSVRAIPIRHAEGENLEWVGVHIDITEERATQDRLAKIAEYLSLSLDAGQTGTWEINLLTGQNFWDNRLFALWGLAGPDAPSLEMLFDIIDARDRESVKLQIDQLQQPGNLGLFETEFRITRASDGEQRWLYARGRRLGNATPASTLIGATRDITDRKKRDQQVQFLMGELNHRTKNILAIVMAIARQTARGTHSMEAFSDAFAQRITAMSGSLDLLIRKNWESASLVELVHIQTSPVMGENGDRIIITGDDVALLPEAAQNLGLALHELATNAAKYGALSVSGGYVSLGWWVVEGAGEENVFSLIWKEVGGPPVIPPNKKGFGDIVMNRLVTASLSGEASLDYDSDGVKWTVRIPVSQILQTRMPS